MESILKLFKLEGVVGKPWYQSLTVWGGIVFLVGDAAVQAICQAGLLPAFCEVGPEVWQQIGVVMTVLGLRRSPGLRAG